MLSAIDRVLLLKHLPLFHESADAILLELAALLEGATVDAGQAVFTRGEMADCMYVVVVGRVKILQRAQVSRVYGPGEAFGGLALLEAQPRDRSAVALEPCLLLKLDQAGFRLVMEDHVELALDVMRVLSRCLRGQVRELPCL